MKKFHNNIMLMLLCLFLFFNNNTMYIVRPEPPKNYWEKLYDKRPCRLTRFTRYCFTKKKPNHAILPPAGILHLNQPKNKQEALNEATAPDYVLPFFYKKNLKFLINPYKNYYMHYFYYSAIKRFCKCKNLRINQFFNNNTIYIIRPVTPKDFCEKLYNKRPWWLTPLSDENYHLYNYAIPLYFKIRLESNEKALQEIEKNIEILEKDNEILENDLLAIEKEKEESLIFKNKCLKNLINHYKNDYTYYFDNKPIKRLCKCKSRCINPLKYQFPEFKRYDLYTLSNKKYAAPIANTFGHDIVEENNKNRIF